MTTFVLTDRDWNDYWQEQLGAWDAREYEGGFDALEELRSWVRNGWVFESREAAEAEAAGRNGRWDVSELDAGDVAELIARFVLDEDPVDAHARAGEARRLAALEEHREGTQFQPLDPDSPSTRLELRIPRSLVDRIDAARGNQSRSEWIRAAIEAALG